MERLWTEDTFEEPDLEALRFLAKNGFPTDMRGDNIFVTAIKEGPVKDRYPPTIYA